MIVKLICEPRGRRFLADRAIDTLLPHNLTQMVLPIMVVGKRGITT